MASPHRLARVDFVRWFSMLNQFNCGRPKGVAPTYDLSVNAAPFHDIGLTILTPYLDEAEITAVCVKKARFLLRRAGVSREVAHRCQRRHGRIACARAGRSRRAPMRLTTVNVIARSALHGIRYELYSLRDVDVPFNLRRWNAAHPAKWGA